MYSLAFALKETTQKLSGLKQPPKNKIKKILKNVSEGFHTGQV